jgi:acyl-CoA thioester hydrolase
MSDAGSVFAHRLTVRFRDCDLMGHVNHAVYLTYFEQCRFAWWRHLGGTMGFPGASTLIVHAECDYRAPSFLNDELEIRLQLASVGRSSVTLVYEIVNVATGQRIAEGKTVNVTVDPATHATIPVPEISRTLLTGQ